MNSVPDCTTVTRFEVIDHTRGTCVSYSPDVARSVIAHGVRVELSLQDDGRTLKVFLAEHDAGLPAAGEMPLREAVLRPCSG